MNIEFKFFLLQHVAVANGGKGIEGQVVAATIEPGDVLSYRVRYWHSGDLKSEWLYEHELTAK